MYPHGLCFITTACGFLWQRASTSDLMLTLTHGEMIRKIYDLVIAFLCVSSAFVKDGSECLAAVCDLWNHRAWMGRTWCF